MKFLQKWRLRLADWLWPDYKISLQKGGEILHETMKRERANNLEKEKIIITLRAMLRDISELGKEYSSMEDLLRIKSMADARIKVEKLAMSVSMARAGAGHVDPDDIWLAKANSGNYLGNEYERSENKGKSAAKGA